MFVSTGHSAAFNNGGCGTPPTSPPANWGNAGIGGNQNQMASVTIYAQDGNNNPANVNYTLKSPDRQIYAYANGSYAPGTQTDQKTFRTGEYLAGDGGYQCNGWDEVGPGIDGQVGNGYVVNCDNGSGYQFQYYITHVDPPAGENDSTGQWHAYSQGVQLSQNVNGGGFQAFNVRNGANVNVQLVWVPSGSTNWRLSGDSTIDGQHGTIDVKPNTSHTFAHSVTNNGPGTASYAWGVYGSVPGNKPSGSSSSVGVNGNNPDKGNFPNRAVDYFTPTDGMVGNTYCEHIHYTNATGPNSGGDDSRPEACVHVTKNPTTGCQAGGCPQPKTTLGCTNTHVVVAEGYLKYVSISGTDGDVVNYEVDPGSTHDFNYTAIRPTININIARFRNTNAGTGKAPNWVPDNEPSEQAHSYGCYHASCGTPTAVDGKGPGGEILAGQQFRLLIPITNDNGDPSAETIGVSPGGHPFSLTEQGVGSYIEHDTGFSLDVGETEMVAITVTAPSGPGYADSSYYPDIWGVGSLGNGCSAHIPVYKHFHIDPHTQICDGTDPENPYISDHTTHGVCYTAGGTLTDGDTTGAANIASLTKNGVQVDAHAVGENYGDNTHTYDYPDSSYKEGDQYCPTVTISPGDGYHGPGYDIYDQNTSASPGCLTVTNRPYFKVYGSGASAGVSVKSTSGTATVPCSVGSGGGILAGWNNNSSGQERGSGAQLSALALVKITGFASAQAGFDKNTGTDAAKLTFANQPASSAPVGTSSTDPELGGCFNTAGYVLKDISPPTSGIGVTTLPNGSSYGGNPGVTGSQSVFVNGDVTITGNIKYAGWNSTNLSNRTVPSFVLHATGNINIAPGVTELDGLFVSDRSIYTCGGPSASPLGDSTAATHYNCNKQLLVYGNLVAGDNVKFQRTFGTLRDEEPVGGQPYIPPSGGGSRGIAWSSAGPIGGLRCTQVQEGSEPGGHTWYDNYICVPPSSSLRLAWTSWRDSPDFSDPNSSNSSTINIQSLQSHGFPYCVQWNVPDPDTWGDNYLCASENIGFSFGPYTGQDCTLITEGADPDASWGSGYWLCAPYPPVSPGQPYVAPSPRRPLLCSNKGAQVVADTCASEVIKLSPEIYLSNPAISLPNGGTGQRDFITSLPPVL